MMAPDAAKRMRGDGVRTNGFGILQHRNQQTQTERTGVETARGKGAFLS